MTAHAVASVRVPGRIEWVRPTACFVVEAARNLRLPVADNRLFEVAIVEALTNAIEHNVRDEDAPLVCEFGIGALTLIVRVLDEGARAPVAFAIPAGPVPWLEPTPESWESIPESGYGLY